MPTIKIFGDNAIVINPRDHFSLISMSFFVICRRCSVAIATLEIIAGSVTPARRINEALAWAKENRNLLQAKWEEIHR